MAFYKTLHYSDPDSVIDFAVSVVQAAQALDTAAKIAEQKQDTETLMTIGGLWIRMAEFLSSGPEIGGHEPTDESSISFAGFQQVEDEGEIVVE